MTTMRWNPWRDRYGIARNWDRFFEPRFVADRRGAGILRIDVEEQPDQYRLTASVPGFAPDDISVSLQGRTVTVFTGSKEKTEQEDDHYVIRERYHGALERRLVLPAGIDPDGAVAAFKHGVLTVDVPKSAQAQPKKLEITTS